MIVDIPLHMMGDYHQTGSSVICNPPVLTTDLDFVILVYDINSVKEILCAREWKVCGNEAYENPDSDFLALRKGNLNYILVETQASYDQWEAAMLLAKERNLVEKADRISLFQNIKGNKKCKSKLFPFQ